MVFLTVGTIFLLDNERVREVFEKNKKLSRLIYNSWFAILFTGVPSVLVVLFLSVPVTYSDGLKAGVLTKITKKGLVFKTYEGELNLGGMVSNGDGGMVANVWKFSVRDEKVFRELEKSQNKRVKLDYVQYIRVAASVGDTSYVIREVK